MSKKKTVRVIPNLYHPSNLKLLSDGDTVTKTVKRSELGRLRMTAGNERKYNKDIMRNVYKELKDRDYDLYQKAIVFAAGLIENINSGAYATNQDACIESEIVKFTMSHLTKTST